jgi:5'-3' exonuclease
MVDNWAAIVSEGEEADDLIAIAATKYGPETIVASIDKDMLQIPCRHFNFNRGDWKEVDPFEGIKFFYTQMLTGDRADNIIGLFKIGPVKADKILDGCTDEISLWNAVVKAYDGDTTRVVENARLLWLRRQENELWQPPVAIAQG